jgi:hypothetical protein
MNAQTLFAFIIGVIVFAITRELVVGFITMAKASTTNTILWLALDLIPFALAFAAVSVLWRGEEEASL